MADGKRVADSIDAYVRGTAVGLVHPRVEPTSA
jgi:hypothetical protein